MANPSNATVNVKPAFGYAGQDMTPDLPTNTYMNESATSLDAGMPVVRGTASTTTPGGVETCKPMAADTDDILGVTTRYPMKDADFTTDTVKYDRYDAVPVKPEGRVAVYAAEDVRGGDEVIVVTAGAGDPTTAFASSKGGVAGAGRVAMTGWKWCGSGTITAGTLAEIEGHAITRGRTTT
jgi:hypothetical protein